MSAYYNEIDPFAAAWLRELIADGLIAPGEVDERDIRDVQPAELAGFTQCHFFAGIGVWSFALRRAGWPDERPVWTGSCPCQPFSEAGQRRGFSDERHLWPFLRDLICEQAPPIFFGEQVAKNIDWLACVRGDLEALDYAVGCLPIEAASAGADNRRDRFWIVAHAQGIEAWPAKPGNRSGQTRAVGPDCAPPSGGRPSLCGRTYRLPEPGFQLLADGPAAELALLWPLGNAINAEVASGFIEAVIDHLSTPIREEIAA